LLSRSRTPQSLKAIAESLDLVPSTALHIARALVAEDLLRVDPQTKHYRLGAGMLPLGAPCWNMATSPLWCGRSSTIYRTATASLRSVSTCRTSIT